MIPRISSHRKDRLSAILAALRTDGCAIVEDVFSAAAMSDVREGLQRAMELVQSSVGVEALERAGEIGVVRAPMLGGPVFFALLAQPELLEIVDAALSPTAILHLQNGFILPPAKPSDNAAFQHRFHRDFNRVLNGFVCSINTLIAVDDFTADNGATMVVPRTHQLAAPPDTAFLEANAVAAECAAGGVVVFDSTLWHAAGRNATSRARCAVNQQFTQSYFKQQIDYVRCLGAGVIEQQPERVRQLLGWYTRVPANLEEFYRADRVYRAGQG